MARSDKDKKVIKALYLVIEENMPYKIWRHNELVPKINAKLSFYNKISRTYLGRLLQSHNLKYFVFRRKEQNGVAMIFIKPYKKVKRNSMHVDNFAEIESF